MRHPAHCIPQCAYRAVSTESYDETTNEPITADDNFNRRLRFNMQHSASNANWDHCALTHTNNERGPVWVRDH